MKRNFLVSSLSVCVVGILLLYYVAGRDPRELRGLVRATADNAVDELTDKLPKEIHDRKLDQDLAQVRQDVIDRQVQLSLSNGQLDQLRNDVRNLAASTERRARLLAEAYPILEQAIASEKTQVRFANQNFAVADFQREIDNLLSAQDREEGQLRIKRIGQERLEKGAKEGEVAIADMRSALDTAEQEVTILRSRREQAEIESKTLDMVTAVTSSRGESSASVGKSLGKLKGGVETIEARNDALRMHAPVSDRANNNELSKGWTRLETLKAIHDKLRSDNASSSPDQINALKDVGSKDDELISKP